jgi:hypothetical protein
MLNVFLNTEPLFSRFLGHDKEDFSTNGRERNSSSPMYATTRKCKRAGKGIEFKEEECGEK